MFPPSYEATSLEQALGNLQKRDRGGVIELAITGRRASVVGRLVACLLRLTVCQSSSWITTTTSTSTMERSSNDESGKNHQESRNSLNLHLDQQNATLSSPIQASKNGMMMVNHKEYLQYIYQDYPLAAIQEASIESRLERDSALDENQVYGELTWESIYKVINRIPWTGKRGAFLDLGSGSGKVVLAASYCSSKFHKCRGVEILPGLHKIACQAHKRMLDYHSSGVSFVCQDFTTYEWASRAIHSVVFCHSTCFDQKLLEYLWEKSKQMSVGSYLLLFQKPPESVSHLQVIDNIPVEATYGSTTVFVLAIAQ